MNLLSMAICVMVSVGNSIFKLIYLTICTKIGNRSRVNHFIPPCLGNKSLRKRPIAKSVVLLVMPET